MSIAFFAIQLSNIVLVKTWLLLDCIANLYYEEIVWRQLGARVFRCVASVAHLFYMLTGGYMSKKLPKKIIDISGVELTPGKPDVCLGNGKQGFECCCDERDFFLLCFPQFDPKSKQENIDVNKNDV